MDASLGLRIISVAKSIEGYQRDHRLAQYFGATTLAGRTGILLSALRKQRTISRNKYVALAATSLIDKPTLNNTVTPWLQKHGFVEVERGEEQKVRCNVLDYDAVLRSVAEMFESLDPSPEERGVLAMLDVAIGMPTTKSDLFTASKGISEEHLATALDLARGYRILKVLDSPFSKDAVVYSPLIWGDQIGKAGRALSHLSKTRREVLLNLINIVRAYQGMPKADAESWVATHGEPDLVEFALGVGLLDCTDIPTAIGRHQYFLTTPHLYGELALQQGRDVCDRIRLFLNRSAQISNI